MKQWEGGVNTVVRGPKLLDVYVVLLSVVVVIVVCISQQRENGACYRTAQAHTNAMNLKINEEKVHENFRILKCFGRLVDLFIIPSLTHCTFAQDH